MREVDLNQAGLLMEKIEWYAHLLRETSGQALPEFGNVEAFLQSFGSYREIIKDNCDTVDLSKHVLRTIQEICQLASNLYRTATGQELQLRPLSAMADRPGDVYQSPKLPTRAETFGGFDERRSKQQVPSQQPSSTWRDPLLSSITNTIGGQKDNHYHQHLQEKRDSYSSEADTISLASVNTPQHHRLSQADISNPNYEALQVSHHLHSLLCIINQQMTTIASLQQKLTENNDNPKAKYKHNDQLEELRNMQDKLQEDKTAWLKQKELQERDLKELREKQEALQKRLQADEADIRMQRDQLYRKLEKLQDQGILLTPNVGLSPTTIVCGDDGSSQATHASTDDHTDTGSGGEKKRDKWRSASSKSHPYQFLLYVLFHFVFVYISFLLDLSQSVVRRISFKAKKPKV